MADDLTPREMARELDRLGDRLRNVENRITDSLRAYDDRLTQLASNLAPIREVTDLRADLAKLEQALADDMRDVRAELGRAADRLDANSKDRYAQAKEANKAVSDRLDETVRTWHERWEGRGQLTWQRILGIAGIIATLLAALITVVLSGKGIH